MRIRRLDLTRYGKFTDHTIDFGPATEGGPDFHIVYGLNESGKSTTFAAFLDLLFGMGDQNRYNFRHEYNAMQIGACLEFDARAHEFVRIKKRTNSLLDNNGQPVNEAMLSAALGGIGRDAYRTMFSLDDQSLEDGGNAIMQSRGELGELLFSASTGLAGLSKSLATAAEDASAIYRKRSSSTRLAELKRALEALKTERNAIDTFATAHAALTATHAQARTSYDAASTDLADVRARHAELTRILGALPLASELSGLSTKLATLSALPRPPAEWFARLPQLSTEETRLQALYESSSRTIDQLEADIAAIAVDEQVLAIGPRIRDLDDGRARYRTADNDLPRRRIACAEQQAMLSDILTNLERAGEAQPESLRLPASLTGIIRDLIETRSGIDAKLESAERELKRTQHGLERLREEGRGQFETAYTANSEQLARIETALARLTGSDLASRLAVEERTCSQLSRVFEAQLALLAPWIGSIDALRALRGTEPRQIEMWRAETASIDKRIADHHGKRRDLITEQRQILARIAAFEAQGPIDDREARDLRHDRDIAWQDHLDRLDRESAKAFEDRMHSDDAVSAARLGRSQELAELRHLTQALSTHAAAIERQEELLAEATHEEEALSQKIGACLPASIAIGKEASERLVTLESWTSRRNLALSAWNAVQQAESSTALIRSELADCVCNLVAALEEGGTAGGNALSVADLTRAASDLLAHARSQQAARATYEKALVGLEKDLIERSRDRDDAMVAAEAWRSTWTDAVSKTWFADKAGSVPAVREILAVLATLPGVLREREQMAQRIATMERDQVQFRDEIAAIGAELGESWDDSDALASADRLLNRHGMALGTQQTRESKRADLDREMANRRVLEEALAVHAASKAELTLFFGADTLATVSLYLEQVRERQRLEERVAAIRHHITQSLRTATYEEAEQRLADIDAGNVEREALELAARVDDLTEHARLLYADMARAGDKLDAVGGDDAVARIEAQRRTIFLEIEDLALRYLKLRTGTLAAEQALHIYREKHRSSMMNRASEAFRLITGGNYSGLATRPDKDKEILIGVARDGGSKLADQMSTGTQFQLYLALRLAGYEEFAAVRPSVPFIADDIMESFDNPRSEEVFRLLGEMAGVGQVIYLTHHWHLCEIATSVVPSVKIHQLP